MARGRGGRFLRLIARTRARRVGLTLTLSALLAALVGSAAHAQPADVRVVTLRAVAEERYRDRPDWESDLRRTVQTVSDMYEKAFRIRFVVREVVPWTVGSAVPIRTIFRRLSSEVPVGTADVIVGFASDRCEKLEYGQGQVFGRVALVQTGCLDTALLGFVTPELALSHEMAHLFGVFHPVATGTPSVMIAGPADRFDSQTRRVITLMRDYDFARGVLGIDAETRRTWSAIYSEGHARNESNPLAGAIAGAGFRLARSGRGEEGEALLREALVLDPNGARIHTLLGYVYLGRGRLEDPVRELKIAKGLDFREVDARTELGFALMKLGREEEALVDLRDVLRIQSRSPRAYVGIGTILARRGRISEAVTAFNSALRVDPGNGPAYLEMALALEGVGRHDDAVRAAQEAHRLGEKVPATLLAPPLAAAPPPRIACPGERILLDDESPSPHRAYLDVVRSRIRQNWVYRRTQGERAIGGDLLLEFRITSDGRVDCLVLHCSSGAVELDEAAITAVRKAQPFPPVPDHVAGDRSLDIHSTFRYQILGRHGSAAE